MSDTVTPTPEPLLEVRGLTTAFPTARGLILAADNVSFSVSEGESVGLVGESGSGKSVTCRSLIGLVPYPGEIIRGEVLLRGRDVVRLSARELRRVRANEVGMVFQDSTSALDPVQKVGHQIAEVLRVNFSLPRRKAKARALELLRQVGIPAAERRYHGYPHEFSGGMRQRVMIAIAIAAAPRLLIADEPTTALDVTIQAQILDLLTELRRNGTMSMILVSHDLGVVAHHCDRVVVMYAGRVVEQAPVPDLFRRPQHPYTYALLQSVPKLDRFGGALASASIPGQTPDLLQLSPGCPFAPRCAYARPECVGVDMKIELDAEGRGSACPFENVGASQPVSAASGGIG